MCGGVGYKSTAISHGLPAPSWAWNGVTAQLGLLAVFLQHLFRLRKRRQVNHPHPKGSQCLLQGQWETTCDLKGERNSEQQLPSALLHQGKIGIPGRQQANFPQQKELLEK